jgi:hypothetical protein
VEKILASGLTKQDKSSRVQRLFHDSLKVILEPLKLAGKDGMEVVGGDGCIRKVYPILACYVADYPEQCLVSCTKYGTCFKCKRPSDELALRTPGENRTQQWTLRVLRQAAASSKTLNQFHGKCQVLDVSGAVEHPFWEDLPYCDIHLAITPDVLHQLYQGVFKHMVSWCSDLMHPTELDARLRCLPPCFGVRNFQNGWSALSQISGKERKDMARVLLGCLVGKVPKKVLIVYRALLDFIYIAQYSSHDDVTLQYLEDALDAFHKHKNLLIRLGVRDHLDIPKIHSLLHYVESIHLFGTTDNYNTEGFERLHVDMAKEGWRASNKREERPQMVRWLSRREKVAAFDRYLQKVARDGTGVEDESHKRIGSIGRLKHLPKQPHKPNQLIQDIQRSHHSPGFQDDLKSYLNKLIPEGPLGRRRLEMTRLPFERLNVYHGFKFPLEDVGDDRKEGDEERDWVRARPGARGQTERFDTVVAMVAPQSESTGVEGEFSFLRSLYDEADPSQFNNHRNQNR